MDSTVPYGYCHCGCGEKTALAIRNEYRRGHRKGEPVPYVRGHNRRNTGPQYTVQECGFTTACWLWNFSLTSEGYGQTSKNGRMLLVHRQYYEKAHGSIPLGIELHHKCENRACINPEHLEPLTHTEHARISSYTKLTQEKADCIRRSSERTGMLAKQFGVSPATICDIRKGRRWGS